MRDIRPGDLIEYDDDYTSGIDIVIYDESEDKWFVSDYPRNSATTLFTDEDRANVVKVFREVPQ